MFLALQWVSYNNTHTPKLLDMKKSLILLLIAILGISFSAKCQISIAEIGTAVVHSNNFEHAKTMLKNDGLVYDQEQSTPECAVFSNTAQYVDRAVIVKVEKGFKGTVSRCIVLSGGAQVSSGKLARDQRRLGYVYQRSSMFDYQEFYYSEEWGVGMGLDLNSRGWLEATFFKMEYE